MYLNGTVISSSFLTGHADDLENLNYLSIFSNAFEDSDDERAKCQGYIATVEVHTTVLKESFDLV